MRRSSFPPSHARRCRLTAPRRSPPPERAATRSPPPPPSSQSTPTPFKPPSAPRPSSPARVHPHRSLPHPPPASPRQPSSASRVPRPASRARLDVGLDSTTPAGVLDRPRALDHRSRARRSLGIVDGDRIRRFGPRDRAMSRARVAISRAIDDAMAILTRARVGR